MYSVKREIQKTICQIENIYPEDNMICDYKSFLKHRDYLHLYQFNEKVFDSLLKLAISLWNSDKRVSRLSLYRGIKRYGYITYLAHEYKYPDVRFKNPGQDLKEWLFVLFKNAYTTNRRISSKQAHEIQIIANSLIIGLSFGEKEEEWLVSNAVKSKKIINRILRYPKKSEIITQWAKENFLENKLRSRRPELISWILDENPDFIVDERVLIDDFEYANYLDTKAMDDYEAETEAANVIEEDLSKIFPKPIFCDLDGIFQKEPVVPFPELKLQRRHYGALIDMSKSNQDLSIVFRDINAVRKSFIKDFEAYYSQTMLWGVAYSRLPKKLKISLLKRHYIKDNLYTLLKICRNYKITEPLKWVLENNNY